MRISHQHRNALSALLLALTFTAQTTLAEEAPPPPQRARQEASDKGFSTWDVQALYGNSFREPGVNHVRKGTATLENSAGWKWGTSYFFMDFLKSDDRDFHANEFYSEWYPSVSLAKVTGLNPRAPFIKDILVTMGFNAGSKTTGAGPLVFLPGVTFDIKILEVPYFQFFSLGVYAYIDRGRINGVDNGCHATTYQVTPSWSLPFELGPAKFRFDGFVDVIGGHGQCAHQIVSQPTVKLDVGNFNHQPNRLFAGVEWGYWRNKYGIKGLNQTAPQAVVMWVWS